MITHGLILQVHEMGGTQLLGTYVGTRTIQAFPATSSRLFDVLNPVFCKVNLDRFTFSIVVNQIPHNLGLEPLFR